jgi:hypothetical protein
MAQARQPDQCQEASGTQPLDEVSVDAATSGTNQARRVLEPDEDEHRTDNPMCGDRPERPR